MDDPKLIDPLKPRIPDEWRRQYMQRPVEKLPGDVAKLFDEQYALGHTVRVRSDKVDKKLLDAESSLRWAKGLIALLSLAIAGSWAVTFGLVKLWLLPILEKVK